MLISLTRSGTFHAKTMKPNPKKCAAMRTRTYRYKVTMEGSEKCLTPEGFVFNNEHVQNYFDNRWGVNAPPWNAVSCEILAMTSAKELCEHARKEADVWRVNVGIEGSNGAWLEASYAHPASHASALSAS